LCLVVANYKHIRPKLQTSDIGGVDADYFEGYKYNAQTTLSDFKKGSESYQGTLIMGTAGFSRSVDAQTGAKSATGYTTYNYGVGFGAGVNYSNSQTIFLYSH